ncbi:YecA family protein [Chungangia koreensis]|uniref:YecA family protein n=1 Tax=Chungangia koreensis TaxID=752657 RepID=A0ABV8X661_9LACT
MYIAERNDPCPCGSGKKFKKCHGRENTASVDAVIDDELSAIMERYLFGYAGERDVQELQQIVAEWKSKLEGLWEDEATESLPITYYLFIQQQESWNDYIEKEIQQSNRPIIKEVLAHWTTPQITIAEVTAVEQEFLTLKDVVSRETFRLAKIEGIEASKGEYAIGTYLKDIRKGSDTYIGTAGISYMPAFVKGAVEKMRELAKKEKLSTQEFYQQHMLDCLIFVKDIVEEEQSINPAQEELVSKLAEFLDANEVQSEKLLITFGAYLLAYDPNAKKPEALLASAIRFGKDEEFLPNNWTNKQLADQFGVSTSTIQKYADEIKTYYHQYMKPVLEDK